MKVQIRPAAESDLATVQNIVRDAYEHYIIRIARKPGPMLDDYAALIEKGCVYVADRDGATIGMIVLIPQTDAMLLDNVAVAPEAQGTGLGRQMLSFAEQKAREAGLGVIKLYTNEAMVENIALYSRKGYVETHRLNEKGLRRVYMRKCLDGPF